MPWALTNYLERRTKDIPASPKVLVLGSMFSAFAAGAQLIYELGAGPLACFRQQSSRIHPKN